MDGPLRRVGVPVEPGPGDRAPAFEDARDDESISDSEVPAGAFCALAPVAWSTLEERA